MTPTSDRAYGYKITTSAFVHGYDGSCPNNPSATANGTQVITVTPIVNAWMNYVPDDPFQAGDQQVGLPEYGLVLRASETNPDALKVFCSGNWDTGTSTVCNQEARQPTLKITYNTPPTITFNTKEAPKVCYDGDFTRVTSTTPTLTGTANDVDIWTKSANGGITEDDLENVRIKFEVWPAEYLTDLGDPDDPSYTPPAYQMVTSGYSTYVNRGTPASWSVPSGSALVNGKGYVWRAIADDGVDTSLYYSEWRHFIVDTSAAPGVNCPQEVLDADTAQTSTALLADMVDAHPSVYAGVAYDDATGAITLYVASVANQSDTATVADARTAANLALNDPAAELTQEQVLGSLAALDVKVVAHGQDTFTAIEDAVQARISNGETAMLPVVSFDIDLDNGTLDIGVEDTTEGAAAAASLTQLYGALIQTHVVTGEADSAGGGPNDAYDNDLTTPHYGGVYHRVDRGTSGFTACTGNVAIRVGSQRYLLTAGHCGDPTGNPDVDLFRWDGTTALFGTANDPVFSTYGSARHMDARRILPANNGAITSRAWVGRYGSNFKEIGGTVPRKSIRNHETYKFKVCRWGAISGSACGLPLSSRNRATTEPISSGSSTKVRYENLFEAKSSSDGACHGDSGGIIYVPIRTGDRAGQIKIVGITHGFSYGDGSGCGDRVTFYPIEDVVQAFSGASVLLAPVPS